MPVLLVLSLFSQQLIDVMSCGHSWPCSLANMTEQQSVWCYRILLCRLGCRFVFSYFHTYTHVTCVTLTLSLSPFEGGLVQCDTLMPSMEPASRHIAIF